MALKVLSRSDRSWLAEVEACRGLWPLTKCAMAAFARGAACGVGSMAVVSMD